MRALKPARGSGGPRGLQAGPPTRQLERPPSAVLPPSPSAASNRSPPPPQPCCTPSLRPLPHTHFPSPADPQLPPHHQAHILSSPLLPHYHTGAPVAKRSSCTLSAWAHPPTRYPIPHAPQLQSPMLSDPPPQSLTHMPGSLLHTRASHMGVSQTGTPLSQTVVSVLHACASCTHACLPHVCLSHMHLYLTCVTHVSLA